MLGTIGYILYVSKVDPVLPTGEYKNAVVESVMPNHSRLKAKKTIFIKTEDGEDVVRTVDMSSSLMPGQRIRLRVYKSKLRGITKYEVSP